MDFDHFFILKSEDLITNLVFLNKSKERPEKSSTIQKLSSDRLAEIIAKQKIMGDCKGNQAKCSNKHNRKFDCWCRVHGQICKPVFQRIVNGKMYYNCICGCTCGAKCTAKVCRAVRWISIDPFLI